MSGLCVASTISRHADRVTVRLDRQRLVRELLGRAVPVDVSACRRDGARDAGQVLPRMKARLILEADARTADERDVVEVSRVEPQLRRPAPLRRGTPSRRFSRLSQPIASGLWR